KAADAASRWPAMGRPVPVVPTAATRRPMHRSLPGSLSSGFHARHIDLAVELAPVGKCAMNEYEPVAAHGEVEHPLILPGLDLLRVGEDRLHTGVIHIAFELESGAGHGCAVRAHQINSGRRRSDCRGALRETQAEGYVLGLI